MPSRLGFPTARGAKQQTIIEVTMSPAKYHTVNGTRLQENLPKDSGARFLMERASREIQNRYRFHLQIFYFGEGSPPAHLSYSPYRGSSDSLACALALAQSYTTRSLSSSQSPLLLFSCEFAPQESQHGLSGLKLKSVSGKPNQEAAHTLYHKWQAAQKVNARALFLQEQDAQLLAKHYQTSYLRFSKDILTRLQQQQQNQPETTIIVALAPNDLLPLTQALGFSTEPFIRSFSLTLTYRSLTLKIAFVCGLLLLLAGIYWGNFRFFSKGPSPTTVSSQVPSLLETIYNQKRGEQTPQAKIHLQARKRPPGSSWYELNNGENLSSEYFYRIQVIPNEKGYLYVLQFDHHGQMYWLFPKNPSSSYSSGQNPVSANSTQLIPEQGGFFLDNQGGVENIYIIFTSSHWKELEQQLLQLENLPSTLIQQPLQKRHRGIGGWGKQPKEVFRGKDGVLVVEKWLMNAGK